MPRVRDVVDAIERIAPTCNALSFDRIGLQLGDPSTEVSAAAVTLDATLGLAEFAKAHQAQLVVCHHPLIWGPLESIRDDDPHGRLVATFLRSGIAFYAAHTHWDAAAGGVSDTLAERLCLFDVTPFGESAAASAFKLVVFVPPASLSKVIDAVSAAGAGRIGLYSRCAFWTPGRGTFVGGEGSKPVVGASGRVEEVEELRVEMRVEEAALQPVVDALLASHPYEEPAYDLYTLRQESGLPLGRIGSLQEACSLFELCRLVDDSLSTKSTVWGESARRIERLAVAGGAADSMWRAAQAAGADALVTGEVKQNVAVDALEAGFAVLAAGHYATEMPGMIALSQRLRKEFPDIRWHIYEPPAGSNGRPL